MREQWAGIAGFEGLYAVSNFGRIKSLLRYVPNGTGMQRVNERILKGGFIGPARTYLKVNLRKDAKSYSYLIHRLVAQAFIPNPQHKPQVNHLKRPKTNNRVTNLEWATAQEDCAHKASIGMQPRGESIPWSKLTDAQVAKMRQLYNDGWKQGALALKFNVAQSAVSQIVLGKIWKHASGPIARLAKHGQDHYLAELTNAQVIEMRRLYAEGKLQRDLATIYGVSRSNVGLIVTGRTWKHIPLEAT